MILDKFFFSRVIYTLSWDNNGIQIMFADFQHICLTCLQLPLTPREVIAKSKEVAPQKSVGDFSPIFRVGGG